MEPVRDLELYRGLEEKLGTPVATALMDRLPAAPADQLVTKTDLAEGLAGLRTELKGDFAELKGDFAELKGDFAGLRGEFGELRGELGELRGEFGELRGDNASIRAELKSVDTSIRAELKGVDTSIRADLATLRHEVGEMKHELIATMRGEMINAIHAQGRLMAFSLIGAMVGLSVLAFAIAGLAA